MPVANYASEMLELWKIGCEENVPIEFESYQKAVRFRFRMYCLRKDMRKEEHPLLPFAEKCMIKLIDKTCIVCPVDDDFAKLLRAQGINIDTSSTPVYEEVSSDEAEKESEVQQAVERWKDL